MNAPQLRTAAVTPPELRIGDEAAGQRLDRALAALAPEGLRGRRRRIGNGGVLVNGRRCTDAARRLRAGDVLALAPAAAASRPERAPRLLARTDDFCVLFKKAGLACAALAGKDGDSLEGRLTALRAPGLKPDEMPVLLQRLDTGTSGLVCAALTPGAVRSFRAAEAAGGCEKRYLAVLAGALDAPMTARRRLDTRQRRTSRVLEDEDGPLRWTEFLPLHVWDGEAAARLLAVLGTGHGSPARAAPALTLAACRIRRGARHQIRAHAAALGHPLWGDSRYGAPAMDAGAEPRFFLHHGFLAWPGGSCSAPPPWPWLEASLPPAALCRAREWLCLEAALPYPQREKPQAGQMRQPS